MTRGDKRRVKDTQETAEGITYEAGAFGGVDEEPERPSASREKKATKRKQGNTLDKPDDSPAKGSSVTIMYAFRWKAWHAKAWLAITTSENSCMTLKNIMFRSSFLEKTYLYAAELLHKTAQMWITTRGFSTTAEWVDQYKRQSRKRVSKSKGLRKELKK